MGVLILTEGNPGTGKSRASLNLDPETTVILRPNSKDLPFRGSRKLYNEEKKNLFTVNSLNELGAYVQQINKGKKKNVIVIEDFSHLLGQRVLEDMNIKGFDKWNRLAADAFDSVIGIETDLRDDLYVILIAHTESNINSDGDMETFMVTPGKLLDRHIKIPSYFTYVLHAGVEIKNEEINYYFLTNRDGTGREAKSPEGCLDLREENDYAKIISKIDAYQNDDSVE